MKNLAVLTGTRAEYFLLRPLLRRIVASDEYNLKLIVTGAHLSEKHGYTVHDIEKDGFPIAVRIPILRENDRPTDINQAMSRLLSEIDGFFSTERIDLLILLGDRYEILSAAIAAMNYRIPIAHIACGDTTQGAIDESIRHAVTKMSSLHFAFCEEHRRRVIQLGENPEHVFNVGSLGVENIKTVQRMTRNELAESLGFDLSGQFAVLTFHPETLGDVLPEDEFRHVLSAIDFFPELKIVFTKSNGDSGGLVINRLIDEYTEKHKDRCVAVHSLGIVRYLTAIQEADLVIGNSSSGILETPSFGTPTVNIGDRQKGRIRAENIIDCATEEEAIAESIRLAMTSAFREKAKKAQNPYGDGETSKCIMEHIDKCLCCPKARIIKKQFYDLP